MQRGRLGLVGAILFTATLAGCVSPASTPIDVASAAQTSIGPYSVRAPDVALRLLESGHLVPTIGDDVQIHVRMVRPDTSEKVPIIVQFTPYTAPGRGMLYEPMVPQDSPVRQTVGSNAFSNLEDNFVKQFVRRGFAFGYADVRGTGDSGGCMDLRGQLDIEDAYRLTEWLGTREWSNGKVGFIGASYPGSEAHIAAIANNPHLGGVIPVVASTSFYNYHHKGGVPYSNHFGTNTGYTQNAYGPTRNPQYENWLERQATEPAKCDTSYQLAVQLDQSGAYNAWWNDRNLRWRVGEAKVPVLMGQGLADWNVKPDHIANYYNDLGNARKILIAGQWPHQYPANATLPDASGPGDTARFTAYGAWWEYAVAFFDETLLSVHTGLFDEDIAFIQGSDKVWRTYPGEWPPKGVEKLMLGLTPSGLTLDGSSSGTLSWDAKPKQVAGSPVAADETIGASEQVVLELPPLAGAIHTAGTPKLNVTIVSTAANVHLVAVLEATNETGAWVRENYGYLNPIYRSGLETPEKLIPGKATRVTIEMYPQEDVFKAGTKLRLILRSVDEGRTISAFDEAKIMVMLDGERPAVLKLPLSPIP
ncbi:MAG: CocE/NonD family hydrolase [Euryarchaeota archaeon]|nr:CocE/NonD family hydrolase [Euryarchaeota archaeon]